MPDEESRPAIPMETKRKVLVEAGHRCAIPTCRHIEVDIHHIIPWAKSRDHGYDNLIALCPNCHRRADRDEIDAKSLRIYKANLRFAHDKYSQFEIDFLFELRRSIQNTAAALNSGILTVRHPGIPFPEYLKSLVLRINDAGFLQWHIPSPISAGLTSASITMGGINVLPILVTITTNGLEFLESLGKEVCESG